jgi:hypothetical protein
MYRAWLAIVLAAAGASAALADGLIWRLPPDGTSAEYQGECHGEFKEVLPKELADRLPPEERENRQQRQTLNRRTTVTVSSVGQVTRAEQKCRWIEFVWGFGDGEHVLKILVPEKYLTRGHDPLDHTILALFNPKGRDRAQIPPEKGFDRIAYELDRFRPLSPAPLKELRQLPKATITTPVGTFADCEVVEGVTEFDRPLLAEGRDEMKGSWRIALHPDAPFGVVQLHCNSTGSEFGAHARCDISTTVTLTLSGKGNNAKSKLAGDAGIDGGGSSQALGAAEKTEKSASPTLKDKDAGMTSLATASAGSGLTSVLRQESIQRELSLSQDQIAKVKRVDDELRRPTKPGEPQSPQRDENARRQLEESLSPQQMRQLYRIVLEGRKSDPTCGLYNPWIADRLKLTSEQRKRVDEIIQNVKNELRSAIREMSNAARNDNREEYEKARGRISKIVEDARRQSLQLLTAGQKEECRRLKGEGPAAPPPDGR